MRSLILLGLALVISVSGCGRKETGEPKSTKQGGTPAAAWIKLDSGLEYSDIKVGAGAEAKDGDVVTVHYKGWLDDETVFDSSKKPGREPFVFTLGAGQVIPGWDQGVKGMKVGGKRELKIPPSLGYGDMEQGQIPANSTLHFEVELLKIGE